MIEILEVRKNNDEGITKIYFDILIPEFFDMILENLCYYEKNAKCWVNLPTRKNGDKWSPYFHFQDERVTEKLKAKAREKLKEYLQND